MSAPVVIEPARFAISGQGISCPVRFDYLGSVEAIDAPAFVPRGGLVSTYHKPDAADPSGRFYVSATEGRP